MRFRFAVVTSHEDATANFEQIQGQLGAPVFAAAPNAPTVGQLYFDTTLVKLRYWTGSAWVSL